MNPYIEHLDKDLNVYHVKNLNCSLHIHSHAELLYVLNGCISGSVGKESFRLKAGDMVFVSPMQVHGYKTEENEESVTVIHIFSPQLLPDFYMQLTKMQPANPFITGADKDECIRFAYYELFRIEWADNVTKKALLHLTLVASIKMVDFIPVKEHMKDNLYKVITYVNEHFAEDICFDDMAVELGISKFAISRIFSQKININFRSYINSLRLEKMRYLFSRTNLTITQVCYESGFANQRTFNRACLKEYGKTPKEIREEIITSPQ